MHFLLKRLALFAGLALAAFGALAESGVSDSHIVIGMSAPLSGPSAANGLEMKQTIEAYFAQVNKSGGINGRKLELIALDDGYEVERTVANTRALIKEKNVFALLAYYGSSATTEAMNSVFGPAKVPLIGAVTGAGTLREPVSLNPNSRYMFNIRASYADESEAIVNQLVSLGLRNMAVFYQNDGFGKSGLDGVTTALKKHNISPSAVATVERNSLDIGKAVDTIAKANPQAVVMVTLYKPTAAFVKALKKSGQNPMLMTLSPVAAELLAQELGPEARGIGISQVMPYPWNNVVPIVRDYQKLLDKPNYGYFGLESYVTARTLVEGLRRSGRDLTREKLIGALEGLNNADLGGYRINFAGGSRAGSHFVELTVVGAGGKLLK